ncbi:unnamed protein product [Prorocentrum cordatum]|uniref:Phospholipase B-like n=1 Tax=Prorocentrum cordatum TaxID=2364126 RepID=A0ABN9VBT5_9DINO|nr:unnamed protein product [Polarella glacialis]
MPRTRHAGGNRGGGGKGGGGRGGEEGEVLWTIVQPHPSPLPSLAILDHVHRFMFRGCLGSSYPVAVLEGRLYMQPWAWACPEPDGVDTEPNNESTNDHYGIAHNAYMLHLLQTRLI